MKTVVITGSARGFGYAMLELFFKKNYNVVICDVNKEAISDAKNKLLGIKDVNKLEGKILSYQCDVTKSSNIDEMIGKIIKETGKIDIWINNAGVNQPDQFIWELDESVIDRLVDIDLKGTILCSRAIVPVMIKQGEGQIFNVEGFGSNDAIRPKLSLYGTAKRAVTYFTEALSKEVDEYNIKVGKITPGIMITNFIEHSLGDGDKIDIPDKTKNVYNILADKPETIAEFMVDKIDVNEKNGVQFTWLTNRRAAFRFIKAMFGKKNNYFN